LQSRRQSEPVRMQPQATLPPENSAGRALCRADGLRRGMEPRSSSRGRVVKATTPSSNSNLKPTPQPVTEVPRQPKVTATRKTAGPKKLEPKSTAATKPAAGKSSKKAAASLKTAAAKPTTPDLVVPTQSPTSTQEDISDLLDRPPPSMCGADSSAPHVHLLGSRQWRSEN
jgi:hypothetical protein